MLEIGLSLASIAALILIIAGIWGLTRRKMPLVKGGLMIGVGLILLLNIYLLTLPVPPAPG